MFPCVTVRFEYAWFDVDRDWRTKITWRSVHGAPLWDQRSERFNNGSLERIILGAFENERNFLCRCFDRWIKYSMAILVTDGTKMKRLRNAFDSFVIVVDLITMILINLKGFWRRCVIKLTWISEIARHPHGQRT